ncbi:MAG: hypothetical protein AMJ90_04925 [candidate division Zixibacteria bacterium SM23_73_2]|nr:MAG: hypothetical protein AMJ90_04925 [candidate division Zixibacteria bacterium SM23_73_2]
MRPQPVFSLCLLPLILVGLFSGEPALAANHIIGPEDKSVYIDQRDPDSNFVSKTGILVVSESNENSRIVIHFDLDGWDPDSIHQAKLCLYHYRGGYYSGSRTIDVHSLTSAFSESTAAWNFPWTNPGGDYDTSISASADVPEEWENWVEWDVTDLLKNRWSNVKSCGFLVKDAVEDTPGDGPYVRFHSHRKDSLPYLEIITESSDVEELDIVNALQDFSLAQNFPNPFNSRTFFEFVLPENVRVNLSIYNIRGQKVKTLLDAKKQAGTHTVEWEATDDFGKPVASGVYLYRLQTENLSHAKRLLYLK